MKDSKVTDTASLPPSLRKQLGGLRRKLRWSEGSKAICAALGVLLVSWLIVFGSDRLWDTPQALLLIFSTAGWASAAWLLFLGYRFAIAQPRYDENLAKTAQTRFPAIGDRLLGVIELCDPTKTVSEHSTALRKAAVTQVAEETGRINLGQAVELGLVKRVIAGFAGLAALSAICAVTMPQATSNAFARWANPLNPTPRYTFASLNSFPTNKIVARGEPFQVLCTIDPESFWLPEQASLTSSRGEEHVAMLNGTSYLFEFKDILEPISFTLKVGDARGEIKVTPLARPSLKQADAIIRYPDYLGYPNERREITHSELNVPSGSTLTLDAFANRPLSEAIIIEESGERRRIPATLEKRRLTVKVGQVEQDQTHRIYWRDTFGLSCSGSRKLKVISQKDEPPNVDFPNQPTEAFVLEHLSMNLTAKATDDYGIRGLSISWTLRNTGIEATETLAREWKNDSSAVRSLKGTHPLVPALLGAPAGSVFAIRAHASDWRVDAEPVSSREILVHVMSVETHAELIRKKIEDLLAGLSEISRLEEDILLETLKLQAIDPEKALDESTQRKAEQAAAQQSQLSEKLNAMSEEGVETLREAMKNPLFTEQKLSEWSQTMQNMQNLAKGEMKEASQSLSKASSSSSQSQQSENLSEAEQSEREILEELQNLQGEINEQLDELEALTLAQRLRKIKRTEDSLDESLTKNLPETIGLRPENLPEKQKVLSENLHEQQFQTHIDAETLKGEISRYHERTNKPQYGQVSEEMEESRASEGLRNVAQLINQNVSLAATEELRHWAVKFEDWAKLLEPEESDGGGGEGGGGECKDITEQLIALLRIRKGEADIRRETMLLDKEKRDVGKELKERSDELGARQRELMIDLTDVQIELAEESLNPLFDDSHSAMADAASKLEKQDSGNETVGAETKAYDLVSDLINLIVESQSQSSSSSQSQSQSASAMQFLLQQFGQGEGEGQGMGMSSFGGGSNQGGDTDSNPAIPRTKSQDTKPGERHFRKASGWSNGLPSEFREALEHYFKEIEE